MEERRPDPEETVHKREWMICWQLYVCPVQVMKIVKKALKTTPLASSVELGMEIALRNGFVVMAVMCGIAKSVQVSYSTVVRYIGIMKSWGFWPKIITPKSA